LRWLQLPTLKYRHFRGDLLEIHKIFNNLYDVKTVPTLTLNLDNRTRGKPFKLIVEKSQYDLRKFSFCNRVIRAWNSLPDSVVVTDSINFFKNNLEKYCMRKLYYYDCEANLPDF